MSEMKYKVIKSEGQYKEYCKMLEELVTANYKNKEMKDEIELLTLLIRKWDGKNNSFKDVDPITLLYSLMDERGLKARDLGNSWRE